MPSIISILLLEDNLHDAQLIADMLTADGLEVAIERVESRPAFEAALRQTGFQIILSDYQLPTFDGLSALALAREQRPDLPFILVSGTLGEELAVECLRAGASDYVLKQRLRRLAPVVRRALSEAEEHRERQKAEEKLRESQALYQSLVEQLPQCVFRKDQEGRFTFVNRQFCNLIGSPANQIMGKTDFDLFPRDLAEKYRRDDARVMESGQVWTSIERHRPAGMPDDRIVEVIKWPLMAGPSQVVGIQGIFWDVTDRERAAEALRVSESRLKEAQRQAHLGSWETELISLDDPSRNPLTWSEETYRIFGYPPDVGRVTRELFDAGIHSEDGEAVWHAIRTTLHTGKPYQVEHRVVRPDGSERRVLEQAELVCDPQTGRPQRLVGTVLDITEQKQIEERVRKLARAVEQSPTLICITDRSGYIEFVNPKFTQVTGYSLQEVLGKKPNILKSGETSDDEYRQLWDNITAGKEWRGEFHNKRKDGTLYWESVSISPIVAASGTITHFIAIKEDITEKKLLEAKLLRAQRIETIGELASGIAHDLNNVLAPLLMSVPMLRDISTDRQVQMMLDTMEKSAERGANIIKQLLTFGRGHPGKFGPLQPRFLVKEMVKIIQETFPKSLELKARIAKFDWTVTGDPTQLHQVLLNLCINARDAMPSGGILTLSIEPQTLDDCFAAMNPAAKTGTYVVLTVQDSGHGIPAEIQERIFEPFFTTKPIGKGTGLGLATCQNIVKAHGGFMLFHSEVGRGTQFKVYLPATMETPVVPLVADSPVPPSGQGETILLVEDEPQIRTVSTRMLERNGYLCQTANNGAEAIAVFAQNQDRIKAVITDLSMPVMDGIATIQALRAICRQIPIIVSTGFLTEETEAQLNGLQVASILHKPFTGQQLVSALHNALPHRVLPIPPHDNHFNH